MQSQLFRQKRLENNGKRQSSSGIGAPTFSEALDALREGTDGGTGIQPTSDPSMAAFNADLDWARLIAAFPQPLASFDAPDAGLVGQWPDRGSLLIGGVGDLVCVMPDAPAPIPAKDGTNVDGAVSEIVCVMPTEPTRPPSKSEVGSDSTPLVDLLPVCEMPPPVSEQPVVETEGFMPLSSGDAPQQPACDMPVPLNQRDPLDLIVSRPLAEAGGYGGDWLSAMIGGPASNIGAIAASAGGFAEADFGGWYDLLGLNRAANTELIVPQTGSEAGYSLAVSNATNNNAYL